MKKKSANCTSLTIINKGEMKNMKMPKQLSKIFTMTEKELKDYVAKELKKNYQTVLVEDGFVYAQGDFPVMLAAHLDTVHPSTPKTFTYLKDGQTVSSPQGIGGDDRCGVYAILNLVKKYHCSVVFCEQEEHGCIGAEKFVKFVHDKLKEITDFEDVKMTPEQKAFINSLDVQYMIELDRKGNKDAVFYECDNPEFEEFITKEGDWETDWGSFSDICTIAPELGVAAVNLSCGYYNAHTLLEYVNLAELENTIVKVGKILDRTTEKDKFEYIEAAPYWRNGSRYVGGGGWYSGSGDIPPQMRNIDYYDDYEYNNYYVIYYWSEDGTDDFEEYMATSKHEALGMFMEDHPTLTYEAVYDIENWGADMYGM